MKTPHPFDEAGDLWIVYGRVARELLAHPEKRPAVYQKLRDEPEILRHAIEQLETLKEELTRAMG